MSLYLKSRESMVHKVDECARMLPKATGWPRTKGETEVRWWIGDRGMMRLDGHPEAEAGVTELT